MWLCQTNFSQFRRKIRKYRFQQTRLIPNPRVVKCSPVLFLSWYSSPKYQGNHLFINYTKTNNEDFLISWVSWNALQPQDLVGWVSHPSNSWDKSLVANSRWAQTDLISWIREILRGDMTALASDFLRSESRSIPGTTKRPEHPKSQLSHVSNHKFYSKQWGRYIINTLISHSQTFLNF